MLMILQSAAAQDGHHRLAEKKRPRDASQHAIPFGLGD
jgi:hypothetical protein